MTGSNRSAKPWGSKVLRTLAALVAALFSLLLLIGATLYLLDDEDYRHALVWSADYFLDSQLDIEGSFSIKFASELEVNSERLRLQANDGSYDLSLNNLYLQQRFTSYIRTGTFWVNKLSADEMQVQVSATPSDEEFDWQTLAVVPVVIEETRIGKLSVTYTDSDLEQQVIELTDILLNDENNLGAITVSAVGAINSQPLSFSGTLGSLEQLRNSQQDFPIEFTLRGTDADSASTQDKPVISVKGNLDRTRPGENVLDATFDVDLPGLSAFIKHNVKVQRLGRWQGSLQAVNAQDDWSIESIELRATDTDLYQLKIDATRAQSNELSLHSEFKVPDPAVFGAQFGIDLDGYAASSGKGRFSGSPDQISYQGKFTVGRIENDVAVKVSLQGSRPSLQGSWKTRELHLEDIGISEKLADLFKLQEKGSRDDMPNSQSTKPTDGQPAVKVEAGNVQVPDHGLIDFGELRKIDLDLDVSVDKLVGADYALDSLAGKVSLNDGLLKINPLRITYQEGSTDLELTLTARKTTTLDLKLKLQNLVLDGLLEKFPEDLQARGKLDFSAQVKSTGNSLDELISALRGEARISLAKVSVPRQYLEYFSLVDVASPEAGDAYTSVQISAEASAQVGEALQFSANAVDLQTNDGSYQVTLGKLNMQQDLAAYRETDTLQFHELVLEDLHVGILAAATTVQVDPEQSDPDDETWYEGDWWGHAFPSLFIEKMQLARLSLDYRAGDQQYAASLSHFEIKNDDSNQPMMLSATGTIDEHSLNLDGTVGTTDRPRGESHVYPIDLKLGVGLDGDTPDKVAIGISGQVDRSTARSTEVNVNFDLSLTELATVLIPDNTAEGLGQLRGEVKIVEENGRWGVRKMQLAAADTDLYQVRVDGEIDSDDKLEITSRIEIPDPPAFGVQFGLDLSGYEAYRGEGVLSGSKSKLNYRGLVNIGRIQSETTLVLTRVNDKLFVQGKLAIPDLYLPDIGLDFYLGADPNAPELTEADSDTEQRSSQSTKPKASQSTKPKVEQPVTKVADLAPIFSREPLDFSGLQLFNLKLEVSISHIVGTDFVIDQMAGEVNLKDGVLSVSPMRLTVEGGETNIDLVLDTRGRPTVSFKMAADNLLLGELISQVQTEVPVEGKAHLDVDVKTSGHSMHEMASELTGDIGFGLENASLPKSYLDFLSGDVFGWMFRMATFEDSHARVDCLILDFDTKQGIAKSNLLVADGPNVIIEGNATVDLHQETIDMLLLPKEKRGIKTNISSARIKGPLRDPSVDTSVGKAAAVGVGGIVLLPQVFIPLGLIDVLWKKLFAGEESGKGCTELIAKYEAKKQEAGAQKSE